MRDFLKTHGIWGNEFLTKISTPSNITILRELHGIKYVEIRYLTSVCQINIIVYFGSSVVPKAYFN